MPERFSASVAARHMACHASADLPAAIPHWTPPAVDETPAAATGTAKHKILEDIMQLPRADVDGFAKILQYVSDLRATRRFKVLTEHTFTAEWLPSKPQTTVDLALYTQDELHVIDYKWGKIPVPVEGNAQGLFYGACAAPLAPKAKGVRIHILQPYAKKYESWFADTNELARFIAEAQAAEAAIRNGSTTFGPSDHCTFCPANPHGRGAKGRPFCPAMMRLLYPPVLDEDAILSL